MKRWARVGTFQDRNVRTKINQIKIFSLLLAALFLNLYLRRIGPIIFNCALRLSHNANRK